MEFNYLSGSSLDNYYNFIFEAFKSGQCYLGYARQEPIWGLTALVSFEIDPKVDETLGRQKTIMDYVVNSTDTDPNVDKFVDKKSLTEVAGLIPMQTQIFFAYTDNPYDFDMGNFTIISNDELAPGGNNAIYLNYINENFMQIQNLSPLYYEIIKQDLIKYPNRKYYILNYKKSVLCPLKISLKSYVDLPFYIFDVNIYYYEDYDPNKSYTIEDRHYINTTPLKQTINVFGENMIMGLNTDNVELFNLEKKLNWLKTDTVFCVEDLTGNLLIPRMLYANKMNYDESSSGNIYIETSQEKFLAFSFLNPNGEEVFLKVRLGNSNFEDYAIWHESLPYEAANPVDDSNPPGLDVTFLKNPANASAMFDILGLVKIDPSIDSEGNSEIEFVKEVKNSVEKSTLVNAGFTIEETVLNGEESTHSGFLKRLVVTGSNVIPLKDGQNFVVGDSVTINGVQYTVIAVDYSLGQNSITLSFPLAKPLVYYPDYILQSRQTNVIARINYAKTTNLKKAFKYGFDTVRVNKEVIGGLQDGSPTAKPYRQLFICFRPKFWDTTITNITGDIVGGEAYCTDNIYTEEQLYLPSIHSWDIGLLLYLSNKCVLTRKYLNSSEKFTILV